MRTNPVRQKKEKGRVAVDAAHIGTTKRSTIKGKKKRGPPLSTPGLKDFYLHPNKGPTHNVLHDEKRKRGDVTTLVTSTHPGIKCVWKKKEGTP